MITSKYLLDNIESVFASELECGRFNVVASLYCGDNILLIEKSKRKPSNVQLFERRANGNSNQNSAGRFFTFSKSTKNLMYPSKHLKTYII